MTTSMFERANHSTSCRPFTQFLNRFCEISKPIKPQIEPFFFHTFPHLTDLCRNPDLSCSLCLKTCLVALTQSILHKHTHTYTNTHASAPVRMKHAHTDTPEPYMQGCPLMLTHRESNAEKEHTHTLNYTLSYACRKKDEKQRTTCCELHIHSVCIFFSVLNSLY